MAHAPTGADTRELQRLRERADLAMDAARRLRRQTRQFIATSPTVTAFRRLVRSSGRPAVRPPSAPRRQSPRSE